MLHLLYIEWLKLKNYRTFWILSSLFIASLFGINYIVYEAQQQAFTHQDPMASAILGNPPFRFPEVWQTVTYVSSFLLFFPGLIIIILTTNEYSFKTHRQNIIDGLSRMQFITVKIVLAACIAMVSTIFVFLVAFIYGLRESTAGITFQNSQYLLYFFIQALSYTLLALLCSVLFRRSGIAIGVYFLYSVVLEEALVKGFNYYFNGAGHYLPLETTDQLIPFPLFKSMIGRITDTPDTLPLLIVAAVYLALYIFICRYKFKTEDL